MQKLFVINDKLFIKKFDGETVLFFLESKKNVSVKSNVFVLNECSSEVIEALKKKKQSFADLYESLSGKYNVSQKRLKADLIKFLGDLEKHSIVVKD